jgi:hypothetical protein
MTNSVYFPVFALLHDRVSTMIFRRTSTMSLCSSRKLRHQGPGKHRVHLCPTERLRAFTPSRPRRKNGESVDGRVSSRRKVPWARRLGLGLARAVLAASVADLERVTEVSWCRLYLPCHQ